MRNIIILSLFLLILCISAFLISCDDFFSPNIEIFNELETTTDVQQNQEQKKKKEQSTDILIQQL